MTSNNIIINRKERQRETEREQTLLWWDVQSKICQVTTVFILRDGIIMLGDKLL